MAKRKSPAAQAFRTEHDSMGELRVPADALCGAQTQRAVDNFHISGRPMPAGFVRALVRAFLLVYGLVVWVATGLVAVFDRKRRTLLDLAMHTEERYLVPDTQQRRYLREQLIAQRGRPTAPAPEPPPVP